MPPKQILDVFPTQDIDGEQPVLLVQFGQVHRLLLERRATPGRDGKDEALEGRLEALGLLHLLSKLRQESLVGDGGGRAVLLAPDAVGPCFAEVVFAVDVDAMLALAGAAVKLGARVLPGLAVERD